MHSGRQSGRCERLSGGRRRSGVASAPPLPHCSRNLAPSHIKSCRRDAILPGRPMVVLECSWRAGTGRIPAPPGCAGVSPALTYHGSEGILSSVVLPAGALYGRFRMFLARWNRAHPRTAWVRGRLARIDLSRERGHLALGCPTRAGRPRSMATGADGERTPVYRASCSTRFDISPSAPALALSVNFSHVGRRGFGVLLSTTADRTPCPDLTSGMTGTAG
jgi:hypothetical protein